MRQAMFDKVPAGLESRVTGWLVYDADLSLPRPADPPAEFQPFDDSKLVPADGNKLLDVVDHSVTLDVKMDNLRDGAN